MIDIRFQEGIAIIDKLVWHLETYDVTSIRASTPMYILSEYIRKMGIKVVLSGEGADEIFGGYLYFHNAPSEEEFQKVSTPSISKSEKLTNQNYSRKLSSACFISTPLIA